jgi:hypothetical protein
MICGSDASRRRAVHRWHSQASDGLAVYPAALIRAYPVDIRVGNARNDDARLIKPLARASCLVPLLMAQPFAGSSISSGAGRPSRRDRRLCKALATAEINCTAIMARGRSVASRSNAVVVGRRPTI